MTVGMMAWISADYPWCEWDAVCNDVPFVEDARVAVTPLILYPNSRVVGADVTTGLFCSNKQERKNQQY